MLDDKRRCAPFEDIKKDGNTPYIMGYKTNFREYVKNGIYPFPPPDVTSIRKFSTKSC